MDKKFKTLIGFDGNIGELSVKLMFLKCEDISYIDDDELRKDLKENILIVATNKECDKHIKIVFDLIDLADPGIEVISASRIKITDITDY